MYKSYILPLLLPLGIHHCLNNAEWICISVFKNLSLLCVWEGTAKVSEVKATSNAPKALIIEPSKELAEQTLNVVKQFKKYVENPKLRYESAELASATCGTHTKTHDFCRKCTCWHI